MVGVVVGSRFQACEPITGRLLVRGKVGVEGEVLLKGREMRVFLTRLLLAAAGMVGGRVDMLRRESVC